MEIVTQIFCFCLFTAFLLHSNPALSQEVEDEREFDYSKTSGHGPERWGEIHPEWSMCSEGDMQSPIDLLNHRVQIVSHLGRLKRNYRPSRATLKNRGHDMMLKWADHGSYIVMNGTQYELKQCHWHTPSEHTLGGRRYDLEVHKVHESPTGEVAVVGILYKFGRPDSFLSSIEDHLKEITDTHEAEVDAGMVDPKDIDIGSRKYYRYIGSLTVPPCTQNVIWTIVRKVRTVSREQVRLLRVAVHDESDSNARPVQPTNGRQVHLYRPDEPSNKN